MPSGIYVRTNPAWNKGIKYLQITGNKNPNWKGGRYKNGDGYIMILKPQHPFADSKGYIRKHRFIVEKQLGRYLTQIERVHHINGIKTDNRIKNLKLFANISAHTSLHNPKGILKKDLKRIPLIS